jgi:hypothetical protein
MPYNVRSRRERPNIHGWFYLVDTEYHVSSMTDYSRASAPNLFEYR